MSNRPAILAEGLYKHYGKTRALAGLDLAAEQGSVLAVLGQDVDGPDLVGRDSARASAARTSCAGRPCDGAIAKTGTPVRPGKCVRYSRSV